MPDAIRFLIRPGVLVFFNHLRIVIVHGGTGTDPHLGSAVHNQLINIVCRFFLLYKKPVLNHLTEHFPRLLINLRRIHVIPFRELCLRPVYPKKCVIVPLYSLSGLFSIVNIVRQRRDPLCQICPRPDCPKWYDICHKFLLLSCILQGATIYFNK